MNITVEILRELVDMGVVLTVTLEDVTGGNTVPASPEDFLLFHRDKDAFSANYYGVAIPDFREWLAADGAPRCGAKTAKGTPCQYQVGPSQMQIKEWLEMDRNDYCAIHSKGRVG